MLPVWFWRAQRCTQNDITRVLHSLRPIAQQHTATLFPTSNPSAPTTPTPPSSFFALQQRQIRHYISMPTKLQRSWDDRLAEAVAYIQKHGEEPSKSEDSPTARSIARFLGNTRFMGKDVLKTKYPDRLQAWENARLPWRKTRSTKQWFNKKDLLTQFIIYHGRFPRLDFRNSEERRLAAWVNAQRVQQGYMSKFRPDLYAALKEDESKGLWAWSAEEVKTDRSPSITTMMEERGSRSSINNNSRSSINTSSSSIHVGDTNDNRNGIRPTMSKRRKKVKPWKESYQHLKDFYQKHNRLPSYKNYTPEEKRQALGQNSSGTTAAAQEEEEEEEEECVLAAWVYYQRKRKNEYHERFPDRIPLLESIPGFTWRDVDKTKHDKWMENLKKVEDFIKTNGRWPEKGTNKTTEERLLRHWVVGMRALRNPGSRRFVYLQTSDKEKRRAILDAQPWWEWNWHDAEWERNFHDTTEFYTLYGRLPRRDVAEEAKLYYFVNNTKTRPYLETLEVRNPERYNRLISADWWQ